MSIDKLNIHAFLGRQYYTHFILLVICGIYRWIFRAFFGLVLPLIILFLFYNLLYNKCDGGKNKLRSPLLTLKFRALIAPCTLRKMCCTWKRSRYIPTFRHYRVILPLTAHDSCLFTFYSYFECWLILIRPSYQNQSYSRIVFFCIFVDER